MATPEALLKKKEKLLAEEAEAAAQQSNQPIAEPATDTPVGDATEPAQPSAESNQPTVDEAKPVVTDTTTTALATFEARIKAAEGVAKKAGEDLRDVRAENQRLQDRLQMQDDMIKLLSKTQQQVEPVKPVQEEPKIPVIDVPSSNVLNDEDKNILDTFDGLMPVFQKVFVTKDELGPIINSAVAKLFELFTNDIAPVRSKVDTIVKTEEQKRQERLVYDMNEYLKNGFPEGTVIPDCRAIDNDPQFIPWTKTMEDLSGNNYFNAYQNAITKTFDAKTAARIQKEFLLHSGINVSVNPAPTPPPVVQEPVLPKKVEGLPDAISDMIAPPRSSATAEPTNKAIDPITEEEVTQAGQAYARNMTPENKQKYEELLLRLTRKVASQNTATGGK